MTGSVSRKFRRQLGVLWLPSLLITLSLLGIVVNGYVSRSNRDDRYALPNDRSAPSMLKFLRKLESEYEPQTTLLSESNLSAIHESIRRATEVLENNRSGLSPAELREALYYRLRFGYLAMMLTGKDLQDEGEWEDLLLKTRRFVNEATQVSRKESDIALYALKTYDIGGRFAEGIELAKLIEDKFRSLPDVQHKSEVLDGIAGIRDRFQLLGTELELATSTLEGKPIQLDQLRGKVVLVDFYTTTCGPCIADFPALKRIYGTYHDRGFEILSVCLHAPAVKIESFVQQHQLPWIHVCHDPVEGNDELGSRFSINSYPTTMLIDRSGRVVKFGVRPLAPPEAKDRDLEGNLKHLLPE